MTDVLKLNIGGVKYCTTKSTLLGSLQENSFFHGLLNGSFTIPKDEKGYIFIDRNGALFDPILQYLRTGRWSIPSHMKMRDVLEEVLFYGVFDPKSHLDLAIFMQEKEDFHKLVEKHKEWLEEASVTIFEHFTRFPTRGWSFDFRTEPKYGNLLTQSSTGNYLILDYMQQVYGFSGSVDPTSNVGYGFTIYSHLYQNDRYHTTKVIVSNLSDVQQYVYSCSKAY